MRRLFLFSLNAFLLAIITSLFTCTREHPCDKYDKPEKEISIIATVHVLDKNGEPIVNQELLITICKVPCGAGAKGFVEFSGNTDENGMRKTTVAYYKLRNLKDEIRVEAYAVNLGNGSKKADSDFSSFSYDDFLSGVTKGLDIHIHRNF
jgi:hypothetical protein